VQPCPCPHQPNLRGRDYYSNLGAHHGGLIYELPLEELLEGAWVDDIAKARHALNAATRLHDKVDLHKVLPKMDALTHEKDPGSGDTVVPETEWSLQVAYVVKCV
jgi:hypothetical protein